MALAKSTPNESPGLESSEPSVGTNTVLEHGSSSIHSRHFNYVTVVRLGIPLNDARALATSWPLKNIARQKFCRFLLATITKAD